MTNGLLADLNVLYDGSCGFCTRAVGFLKKLDRSNKIVLTDYHDEQLTRARFPGLDRPELENAMHVVTSDGRVFDGFFALRRTLISTPVAPLVLILYLPGMSIIGTYFYSWFARNRGRLGCSASPCANGNLHTATLT